MKGQAVNIDWVTGLSLFTITLISGIFILVSDDVSIGRETLGTVEKAEIVQSQLEEETGLSARKVPLYVRGPNSGTRIPVDTEYVFPEGTEPGSAVMDIPAEIYEGDDRAVTVLETGNRSREMVYFFSSVENLSHGNDIETGDWLNNSRLAVKPGGNGVESLRIDGSEVLNASADLGSTNDTVFQHELHASTLGGDLKLYNGSSELVLENAGSVTFDLRNFTDLYWSTDGSVTNLEGTGTFKSGNTEGFTLATFNGDDYGVTFLGDMDATVSKPGEAKVEADIDTGGSRLRIYFHDSDYTAGEKRIESYRRGDIFFGSAEKIHGPSLEQINEVESMREGSFENRFELETWGYNITLGPMERGMAIPLQEVVVRDRPTAVMGRYGNFSSVENRVALWR